MTNNERLYYVAGQASGKIIQIALEVEAEYQKITDAQSRIENLQNQARYQAKKYDSCFGDREGIENHLRTIGV